MKIGQNVGTLGYQCKFKVGTKRVNNLGFTSCSTFVTPSKKSTTLNFLWHLLIINKLYIGQDCTPV